MAYEVSKFTRNVNVAVVGRVFIAHLFYEDTPPQPPIPPWLLFCYYLPRLIKPRYFSIRSTLLCGLCSKVSRSLMTYVLVAFWFDITVSLSLPTTPHRFFQEKSLLPLLAEDWVWLNGQRPVFVTQARKTQPRVP